jgi:hypothetical protein
MGTILLVLFVLAAILTAGGIAIIVALAPKPRSFKDHLQGLGRYLMVCGVLFNAVRVLGGWKPHWDTIALMVGLAIGMAIYARENNLIAKAQERLEEGQESGV